jgi:hypothetical protein
VGHIVDSALKVDGPTNGHLPPWHHWSSLTAEPPHFAKPFTVFLFSIVAGEDSFGCKERKFSQSYDFYLTFQFAVIRDTKKYPKPYYPRSLLYKGEGTTPGREVDRCNIVVTVVIFKKINTEGETTTRNDDGRRSIHH